MVEASRPPAPRPDSVDVRVARILKAHGLKGGVKLEIYTDVPELRFQPGKLFSLQVPRSSRWFEKHLRLTAMRIIGRASIGFFEEINDRAAAESLSRAILWVQHHTSDHSPESDAWFDHDLIGLSVESHNLMVGKVIRVEHLPAQDLLVVQAKGSEVMVPLVTQFVPKVDIEAGVVVVTPPDGLFGNESM